MERHALASRSHGKPVPADHGRVRDPGRCRCLDRWQHRVSADAARPPAAGGGAPARRSDGSAEPAARGNAHPVAGEDGCRRRVVPNPDRAAAGGDRGASRGRADLFAGRLPSARALRWPVPLFTRNARAVAIDGGAGISAVFLPFQRGIAGGEGARRRWIQRRVSAPRMRTYGGGWRENSRSFACPSRW